MVGITSCGFVPFLWVGQAPVSPWALLYLCITVILTWTGCCYQGSVETVPSLSSCRASGSPWVTGQDLATILGTWSYPLKGIFLMILSLRALPWVRESRPLTGKFQGMQLRSLAVGDNVTDSRSNRPRGNSLSRVELVLSARLLCLDCTPLSMVAWVFRSP